jgi:hypothetical protein
MGDEELGASVCVCAEQLGLIVEWELALVDIGLLLLFVCSSLYFLFFYSSSGGSYLDFYRRELVG